ncbi:MAG: hypothetical protein RI564_12855 [Gracilimonas sp.]|jgi:antitoxin component YwqK of YwqJK toxin-antitoxin module|nr:hypothetical protein [Gracilimonas sp.]
MKNNLIRLLFPFIVLSLLIISCEGEIKENRAHYFLRGYDELEFRDQRGNAVYPSEYIRSIQLNGQRVYQLRDTTLTLVHKITDEPYDGYIRTFHRDRFNLNLQGEFEDGKMYRLRYWHPNRTLGMDANYRDGTQRIWSIGGNLMVESNEDETYYYYPGMNTNVIKEIISDTMRSFFDENGNLERYTIFSDTANIHYYGNGQKRTIFPYKNNKGLDGVIREWYPNGQLKLDGKYEDGEQVGTWIKYDSLGNVEERIEY